MDTWKEIPPDSDFTIHNLPFGIFSSPLRHHRVGVAIGEDILDLAAFNAMSLLEDIDIRPEILTENSLNSFITLGKKVTTQVRTFIQQQLCDQSSPLKEYPNLFVKQRNVTMHLPVEIGDYTDFYSSLEHATNVGKLFRDPDNALLPNWRHLPVAYHGRSSSVVVSGTHFNRPKGQILDQDNLPVFKPSSQLDFELEMAFIVGKDSVLGDSISTSEAEEYIFGLVLLNDWSARDIQKWEYVPLGPFLGKNFATSISPWVVPLEALEPFKVQGPEQIPRPMHYLDYSGASNYDIQLEAGLIPAGGDETVISRCNTSSLYWNMKQQLAHHTVNGCNVRIGDLMASGTISGPHPGSFGSLLELTDGGKVPVSLMNGRDLTFLEDYDTVILRAKAERENYRVGFGEVTGQVLPASK
jgi:fumarylacetoacetase